MMPMDLLGSEDYDPCDRVTLTRIRDAEGEPTEWVETEGLRDGRDRSVTVRYGELWDQATMHLEFSHGKGRNDPVDTREFAHAIIRAAVAFLLD
jgi:hypothetical protein